MFIFSLVCQGDWVIFVDQLDMNTPRWTKEKKRMQKQAGFDDQKGSKTPELSWSNWRDHLFDTSNLVLGSAWNLSFFEGEWTYYRIYRKKETCLRNICS